MANTVVSLVSIALLCVTIAQGRPNFEATPSSVNDHGFQIDGICQTAVVTQGYKCEEHQVQTDDGYILSLQRLPAGRSGKKADKPPVLLQHGLFCHLGLIGLHEFIPNGEAAAKLVEGLCTTLKIDCSNPLAFFTGPNCCLNSTKLNSFLDHGLQSTATQNLIHLSQMIRTGSIAKYDYRNPLQNGQHYGGVLPPPYDFTAMPKEFPLFLSYGGSDMLSDVNDVQLLLNDLKNHVAKKLVVLFRKEYAHVDFFMATNVKQVLYDPILSFFLVN
ncbi:hypothetical protein ACSQ67_011356 [Phaseolus vulgaris]